MHATNVEIKKHLDLQDNCGTMGTGKTIVVSIERLVPAVFVAVF